MSFKDVGAISNEYISLADDVIGSFYIPCLAESVEYKRATAFFSSSVLLQITKGLSAFTQRGGKIKLLVSPNLSKEDYEAIEHGYDLRKKAEEVMSRDFDEEIDFFQKKDRFTMLSYLIEKGILEIKVAIPKTKKESAIYHEKLGIMIDGLNNKIVFSGSANETTYAYEENYEVIDVFCDWKSDDSYVRCYQKDLRFDAMWENEDKTLVVVDFPTVIKDKILKYNDYQHVDFPKVDADLDAMNLHKSLKEKLPKDLPSGLYTYQEDAIQSWVDNNYQSSLVLATGSGKTFIGCGAIKKLFDDKKRLAVVICCPYVHLVDQWAEDIKNFNIEPIIYYSATKTYDILKSKLSKFQTGRSNFVCVITTNGSFMTPKFQELFNLNINETLLLADEAHNLGAKKIRKYLDERVPYRLALSATLVRNNDLLGTKAILDYFGKVTFDYPLERAISEGKLTPYYYYPIPVYLNEDEYDRYMALTEKISKFHIGEDDEMPDALKILLTQRARIIAETRDKLPALLKAIKSYENKNNLLIYCGAVKYDDSEDGEEKRQIEEVINMLMQEYGIVSVKFTSEETTEERQDIIKAYKNDDIQAIVAIKCLDEGVNIPAIKTAFILASSTNPKEYIQRRGRVLRKYPGKDYAEIYDFITLPRPLNYEGFVSDAQKKLERGLAKREFSRMLEFSKLSKNPSTSNKLIDEIKNFYNINTIEIEEDNLV